MLLTRTRRELLKGRTIDTRIYVYVQYPTASLSSASRFILFVTAAIPPYYIPTEPCLRAFFSSASFINHRYELLPDLSPSISKE